MKIIISILITTILFIQELSSQFVFVGPMVHWRFGSTVEKQIDYGLEASFWEDDVQVGVDLGVDFSKNKFRVYSELEPSLIIIGLSGGMVVEFSKNEMSKLGFQGSVWAACFAGVDYRFRILNGENIRMFGLFAKAPVQFHPHFNSYMGNTNNHNHFK
jgi:hypothetical protein